MSNMLDDIKTNHTPYNHTSSSIDYDYSSLDSSTSSIPPQWDHPFLHEKRTFTKKELIGFIYDYYIKFTPFFKNQEEGSLLGGIEIILSSKLRQGLGLANIFDRTIKLNEKYFTKDPTLIPYTLFHELTHIWLYDCYKDPSHTKNFYKKMKDFTTTHLPIDPKVYIHSRIVNDSKFIYICPNCKKRWFSNKSTLNLYCGFCKEIYHEEYIPICFKNPDNLSKRGRNIKVFQKPDKEDMK